MGEWWTYGISDLVLFTPETYFRLFESYHRDWWPLQLACLAMVVVILSCLRLKPVWGGRLIAILLAASWAWIGWAFLHLHLTVIHWVADWYAIAFYFQTLLLFACGVARRGVEFETGTSARTISGVVVLLAALLVMPAIAYLTGREWMQAELFAMTPDATALATLGLLLLAKGRAAIWLMVIPLAWCFVSAATLWVLEAPEAIILSAGAMLTIATMFMPVQQRG